MEKNWKNFNSYFTFLLFGLPGLNHSTAGTGAPEASHLMFRSSPAATSKLPSGLIDDTPSGRDDEIMTFGLDESASKVRIEETLLFDSNITGENVIKYSTPTRHSYIDFLTSS